MTRSPPGRTGRCATAGGSRRPPPPRPPSSRAPTSTAGPSPRPGPSSRPSSPAAHAKDWLGRPKTSVETVTAQRSTSYDGTQLTLQGTGTVTTSRYDAIAAGENGALRDGWGVKTTTAAETTILKGTDLYGGALTQTRTIVEALFAGGRPTSRTEDVTVDATGVDGSTSSTTTRTVTTYWKAGDTDLPAAHAKDWLGRPKTSVETVTAQRSTSYDGTQLTLQGTGTVTTSRYDAIAAGENGALRDGWGVKTTTAAETTILKGTDLYGGALTQTRTIVEALFAGGRPTSRTEDVTVDATGVDGSTSST